MTESKYVDKKSYRSRYAPERVSPHTDDAAASDDVLAAKDELPKFVPFLTRKCGVGFFGRILEIGAGGAWLSAELSRLPKVVEVIATDFSPTLLKDHAPKVFQSLKANPAKITRTPGDFHELDFPDNYFDFVVCSAALHQAVNMVQVLREVKRVLKPGGQFVAIREPVWPRVKFKSRPKSSSPGSAVPAGQGYTLTHYKELFKQASLPLLIKRVNLSHGFKYYVNEVVNGLTHARYAFIGRKRGIPVPAAAGAASRNSPRMRWLLSGPRARATSPKRSWGKGHPNRKP
jgi:ubiquinone/menaquinone biosynthesis C-methylase UbiE